MCSASGIASSCGHGQLKIVRKIHPQEERKKWLLLVLGLQQAWNNKSVMRGKRSRKILVSLSQEEPSMFRKARFIRPCMSRLLELVLACPAGILFVFLSMMSRSDAERKRDFPLGVKLTTVYSSTYILRYNWSWSWFFFQRHFLGRSPWGQDNKQIAEFSTVSTFIHTVVVHNNNHHNGYSCGSPELTS